LAAASGGASGLWLAAGMGSTASAMWAVVMVCVQQDLQVGSVFPTAPCSPQGQATGHNVARISSEDSCRVFLLCYSHCN